MEGDRNTTWDPQAAYAARGVNPHRLEAVLRWAGRSVLDAGCGPGAYVLALRDRYDITGIDATRFDRWDEAPELFTVGDAGATGLPDDSVDTVICFETLEHLPDPDAALRDFHRIARKNVILTVPNCELTPGMDRSRLIYYHWINPEHLTFYTPATIEKAVTAAGFQVVENGLINDIDLWPLLGEAFDFSGPVGRAVRRLLAQRRRTNYRMTSLVVADKHAA